MWLMLVFAVVGRADRRGSDMNRAIIVLSAINIVMFILLIFSEV